MGYKRNDWKFLEGINKKIETFYPFPKEIRSGTRTSSLSGKIKRKERLPDESVLERIKSMKTGSILSLGRLVLSE